MNVSSAARFFVVEIEACQACGGRAVDYAGERSVDVFMILRTDREPLVSSLNGATGSRRRGVSS